MSDRIARWASTSARVVVGAGIAVAAVVAVTAAIAAPWPSHSTEPVRVEATPAASDTVLACDGALLALGRVVEEAGTYTVAAEQQVVSGPGSTAELSTGLRAPADSTTLALTAPPAGGASAALAASGSASVTSADLRGFAASACRAPLMESWLVGGSTTTGSADIVLIANPGDVAATVQLTVFGAAGPQTPPGGTDLVVPAGEQLAVPLAGLVSNEQSPVVRVTATGAPVSASLQTSIVRTLEPGGVEQVGAIAAAATRQTVPDVTVVASPGEPGASDPTAVLRLLSPGADAQARVRVVDAEGATALPDADVPLLAGVPSEFDLGSLEPGTYTITVTADAPVVASAWSATGLDAGSDFAWFTAAPDITLPSTFAVPDGAAPVLTLVNTGDAPVTVSIAAESGAAATGAVADVELAPGETSRTPVTAGSVYSLDPSGAVAAAVTFSDAGALAGFAVWGADAAAQPIAVFP